jgi:hypothetical protein
MTKPVTVTLTLDQLDILLSMFTMIAQMPVCADELLDCDSDDYYETRRLLVEAAFIKES